MKPISPISHPKKRYFKGKQTNGFTLIELLVVISIISLLIAILLPALSRARDAAKVIQCAANHHQISLAMTMYQGSNKDNFPNNDASSSNVQWDDRLGNYDGRNLTSAQKNAWRLNLADGSKSYLCPSDTSAIDASLAGGQRRSYSLNNGGPQPVTTVTRGIAGPHFNSNATWSQSILNISKPSEAITVMERPHSRNAMGGKTFDTSNQVELSATLLAKNTSAWVHEMGRFNWLFADGHGQYLNFSDTLTGSPAALDPEAVGWTTSIVGSMWDTWK